jgi:hypothetical protein
MFRHAIRLLARTALVFSAAAAFSAGCTRQAEGERCDAEWAGDQDCESGLICKACGSLADVTVDRCCPPGDAYGVAECRPSTTPDDGHFCSSHHAQSTGGSSGAGGTSGSGGTGDTGATAGAGDTGGAAGDRG